MKRPVDDADRVVTYVGFSIGTIGLQVRTQLRQQIRINWRAVEIDNSTYCAHDRSTVIHNRLNSRYFVFTTGESLTTSPPTSAHAWALGGKSWAARTISAGTPRRRSRQVTTAECWRHIAFFG